MHEPLPLSACIFLERSSFHGLPLRLPDNLIPCFAARSYDCSTVRRAQGEEGGARVDMHVHAGRAALGARGTYMGDRRNRSVLVSMVAGASIVGAHKGSHCHVV